MQLVEHDDGGTAVVVHQPPEVRRGALQRVQRHDEGCAPCVALQGNHDSQGPVRHANTARASATGHPPTLPTVGPGCLQWPILEVGWNIEG